MEFTLFFWLVLSAASFRITRFFVIDTMFEGFRNKIHVFLVNRHGKDEFLARKFFELTSCTWCLGFWVSLLLYSIFVWHNPTAFSRMDWINVFAVAGGQGMLHAIEPSD